MPSIKGSFSGRITKHSEISLTDQPNHVMNVAEVSGPQNSRDPLWNDANITYWAATDLVDGKGSQRGYFDNVHSDKERDWGTFEGKVSTKNAATIVVGTWKYAGGSGKYRGIKGSGKFKVVMKSETDLACNWSGNYRLRKAR